MTGIKYSKLQVNRDLLKLTLDGKAYAFCPAAISGRLASASAESLRHFIVSPSGYGIYWHDIDEDISIPALIMTAE